MMREQMLPFLSQTCSVTCLGATVWGLWPCFRPAVLDQLNSLPDFSVEAANTTLCL